MPNKRNVTPSHPIRKKPKQLRSDNRSKPQRGRPPKPVALKYHRITIRIHPDAIRWARAEAGRLHIHYQTVINNALRDLATK